MRNWSQSLLLFAFFTVSAGASTFSTTRISNDASRDFETTVVRQTAGTVTATIMGYIKYPSTLARNHYVSRGDDGQTFSGMLGLPANESWNYSADPYLAPNQTASAVHPQRTYMVGTLGVNSGVPTGIAVWSSDDAGRNWSAPTVIARTAGTANSTDKPHIAVSQHSASAGYVYVAYMQRYVQNSVTRYGIRIARSTDGDNWYGAASGEDVEIFSSTSLLNCAQVVVAPANGYIYVTWVDYGANKIMLARSAAAGSISGSWVIDSGGPTGNFFGTGLNMNGSIRGMTVPITRYNWKTNKVIVVWNERESATSNRSDVYVAAKGTTGWQAKQKISNEASPCVDSSGQPATTDQWRPAVDFMASGDLYITYYDRQRDCANDLLYDLYFVRLGNGSPFTVLEGPTRVSAFQSDASLNSNAVGEYHEVWCDATVCYNAWIGADTQPDVFLSTIQ